jgi:two-component system response regulator FixJ
VLGGVSSGLSGREIGERLGISARTVEIHRSNFKRKLGMRSLSEVLRLAFEAELVPSPALWGPGRLAG